MYAEPYDPKRPVACFDECRKERHARVAEAIPGAPGHPAKEDDEYVRNGTATLLVITEPPAGARPVRVTDRRTTPDFAARMTDLCDELYPDAGVTRVVVDNRSTHTLGSVFSTYPPDEAWRLARTREFHSPPEHASWRNMAGCERGVPGRPCLGRRRASKDRLSAEVATRVADRNRARARIEWTFRVADARKELGFLYPTELQR